MRAQHGVVTRRQLLRLGFSAKAIEHRIGSGRLHRVFRGVYAVGRPQLSVHGRWMAAVLACGPEAALSHKSAASLWGIRPIDDARIEVSVPAECGPVPHGITVHRRAELGPPDLARRDRITVTGVVCTLTDLAAEVALSPLEAAINEADKLDLIDPDRLRRELETRPRRPGVAILRRTLDRRVFTLTDSALERRFLPIARQAGLPKPLTQQHVNGFRVDFVWPGLDLVVETDGLRYHRTPAQQARDRVRDQAHARAGTTSLRFTHPQVRFEPTYVRATLTRVARRLKARSAAPRSG